MAIIGGGERDLTIKLGANIKEFEQEMKKASNKTSEFGSRSEAAFAKVGKALAIGAAAAGAFAVKFGVEAVKAASDLEETVAKVGQIFGDSGAEVEKFAQTAAVSLGQSKQQALDASATFAIFGKAAGLAGSDLVDFSTDFTVLASDLASFNNTSPEQAIQAIGSALRGEAEPLRSYGVLLNDATLKQAALELGIISTTKEALTPQQKVLAAQKVIYEQTADAQGDFERTSDGLANQSKILKARLEDISTEIGTALLPIVTDLAVFFGDEVIPIIEKFGSFLTEDLIPQIRAYTIPAIEEFIESLSGLASAFGDVERSADDANFSLSELAFGTEGLVTTTINAGTRIVNVWLTTIDVLNRLRAFISGDMDTAFREFENRFKDQEKAVNNVNESMVKAYTQFGFYNSRTKNETTPLTKDQNNALKDQNDKLKDGAGALDKSAGAALRFAGAQNQAANAVRQLTALQRELNALQAGGAIPSALSPDMESFFRSELNLISQFGGLIGGINLNPDDPFFGFGQGSNVNTALRQRAGGSATATGGVTINVTGTVIDPEGAARAIQQIIDESNARGGELIPFGGSP
jgi:hypothetical protein